MKKLLTLTVLALSTLAASAQFKPTLTASLLGSPEKPLQDVKKVAVFNFENRSSSWSQYNSADIGSQMSDYIVDALLQENRGKGTNCYIEGARTNVYTVLERDQLTQIIQEQQLGASGMVDDNNAVEIGKLAGVDALIVGSISYTKKDEKTTSKRTDSKTKKVTITYMVTRTVTAESSMKIISVKTGQILGTKSSRAVKTDKKSSTKTYPSYSSLTQPQELARQASQNLAATLVNYFTPRFYSKTFTFENIKNKELKERIKDAKKDLKDGKLDKAYAVYDALYQQDSYNARILFNLAALHEVVGNYDKSVELYTQCVNIDGNSKTYEKGLDRATANAKLSKQLAGMGINIVKHEFNTGGSTVLAERVKTKGNRKSRHSVYADANASSKILAKVPGDLEFVVIEKKGDWVKIKLATGGEGYIQSDLVQDGK